MKKRIIEQFESELTLNLRIKNKDNEKLKTR